MYIRPIQGSSAWPELLNPGIFCSSGAQNLSRTPAMAASRKHLYGLRLLHVVTPWRAHRYSSFKALLLGFVVTFFPVFDVPVFWPILLMYWLVLLFVTMKRQIKHMIKYRYIPFSFGKKVRGVASFSLESQKVFFLHPPSYWSNLWVLGFSAAGVVINTNNLLPDGHAC